MKQLTSKDAWAMVALGVVLFGGFVWYMNWYSSLPIVYKSARTNQCKYIEVFDKVQEKMVRKDCDYFPDGKPEGKYEQKWVR